MRENIAQYLSQYEFYDYLASLLGGNVVLLNIIIFTVFCSIFAGIILLIGALGTLAERKIAADIQARLGPNRVGVYGSIQFLADGLKLIQKEDILPFGADKFLFYLGPFLFPLGVFLTLAVLPVSSGFLLTDFDVSLFYYIAVSSLMGVAVFVGGYAPNSKWSLLGGMRGVSQIISYEIPLVLSALLIVLLSGSVSLKSIVQAQDGYIWNWFIFHNPFSFVAFFIYFISGMAEANRAPFDLPEAESELVSGYHTEYTGMRWTFYALLEYGEVFVICGVAASIFLGGYTLPFPLEIDNMPIQFIQLVIFTTKTLLLYYVVIWARWTLPRLRVDHLMSICWKYLTPIAIFNLVGTAIWIVMFNGKSLIQLIFN